MTVSLVQPKRPAVLPEPPEHLPAPPENHPDIMDIIEDDVSFKRTVDLHPILTSNLPPDARQATAIRKDIASLSKRIAITRRMPQKLESELALRKGALSPIRALPLEIIGQIFFVCAQDEPWELKTLLPTLQLICKRWCQAALLRPDLWSKLRFRVPFLTDQAFERVVRWFKRAGGVPTKLWLECGEWCECPSVTCPLLCPTVSRLLTSAEIQLSHLTIHCAGPQCLRNLVGEVFGRLNYRVKHSVSITDTAIIHCAWNSLKSLEVKMSSAPTGHLVDAPSTFERLPPNITQLDISFPESPSVFDEVELARTIKLGMPSLLLQRLVSFRISCDWLGPHILEVLQHCSNVERLTISLGLSTMDHYGLPDDPLLQLLTQKPITLPRLRTLDLDECRYLDILDVLVAPALEKVRIGFHRGSELPFPFRLYNPLIRFLSRSNRRRQLLSLHLYDLNVADDELIRTLGELPGLTHLTIEDGPYVGSTTTFWDQLCKAAQASPDSGGGLYLPRLERLHLSKACREFRYFFVVNFFQDWKRALGESSPHCTWKISYANDVDYPPSEECIQEVVRDWGVTVLLSTEEPRVL